MRGKRREKRRMELREWEKIAREGNFAREGPFYYLFHFSNQNFVFYNKNIS